MRFLRGSWLGNVPTLMGELYISGRSRKCVSRAVRRRAVAWPLSARLCVAVVVGVIRRAREGTMQASTRFGKTLLLCGSLLVAGLASAGKPEASAGDCFAAAFESGNADAIAACYAEDAIIWFPGGRMAKGRLAIREGFAHFLSTVTVKDVELTTIGHEGAGDTSIAWGTYIIRMIDKATQAEIVQRGRFTDVQKKIDGRWLYIVDHPSDDPPASAQ
ncbi:MAG TPA: nuclear transport factor 2 family protein [Thermomonas sp.]|nr:nuclear transport factor 2 family protein [Thermomonas sp.]